MAHNRQLAAIFAQMADLNDVTGGNGFRSAAFQRVARVIEDLPRDVADYQPGELKALDGVGAATADRITEFLSTGHVADHQAMLADVPPGLLTLLNVPGLGPKGVHTLWKQADVDSVEALREGIADGRIEKIKGFGKKKVANLLKSLDYAAKAAERRRLGTATLLADLFTHTLQDLPGVERLEAAGSLRRGKETIGDLDLLIQADQTHAPAIFEAFINHPLADDVLVHGSTKASIRTTPGRVEDGGGGEVQVDLRIVAAQAYGAALLYFTGSKEHNVQLRSRALDLGLTLNEYALTEKPPRPNDADLSDEKPNTDPSPGRVVASRTETDIYAALGLACIPPELREGRDELDRAELRDGRNRLPELVTLDDLQAELHAHTTASDGVWSLDDLIQAAIARGFHTVAITDHSKSQVQANGLSAERLEQQIEQVRDAADRYRSQITVLAGSECDILTDGTLDYPDSLLAELDHVVASPHAALTQDDAKATRRLLKALENPHVTVLGHPTGRLILRREGLSPDITAVAKAAAQQGVALEINANHYRLDLRDTHARIALDHGCKLAINTDAHGPGDLDQARFGVLTARRAGATKADIINCLPADALASFLNQRKA